MTAGATSELGPLYPLEAIKKLLFDTHSLIHASSSKKDFLRPSSIPAKLVLPLAALFLTYLRLSTYTYATTSDLSATAIFTSARLRTPVRLLLFMGQGSEMMNMPLRPRLTWYIKKVPWTHDQADQTLYDQAVFHWSALHNNQSQRQQLEQDSA